MQSAPGHPRSEVLGFASTGGDPRQDGRGVGALREDCGTLDDLATGGVRPRQARDQGPDRVVVHGSEASRRARESTRLPSRRRATGLPGRTSLTPAVSKPVAARARPLRARVDHPDHEQRHRRLGRDLRRHASALAKAVLSNSMRSSSLATLPIACRTLLQAAASRPLRSSRLDVSTCALRHERRRRTFSPGARLGVGLGNACRARPCRQARSDRAKSGWKWSVLMTAGAFCGCRKHGSACDLVLRCALSPGRLAGWV